MSKERDATRSRDLKVVALLKSQHLPGTPCPRCGQPMWDVSTLDGSHADGEELVYGGGHPPSRLEHRRCNRSHGGRLSRARTAARRRAATAGYTAPGHLQYDGGDHDAAPALGTTQFW